MSAKAISLFDREIMLKATTDAFRKLNPRLQLKNPVMFVTLVGALLTFEQLFTSTERFSYVLQVALWLFFTVIFANFAEAVAEGRGKAQARALRASRKQLMAQRRRKDGSFESVDAAGLVKGDVVFVKVNELIPGDGEVIEGAASVDESAITGESAPVIREAGGDRSAVTGGTRVTSDRIVIRVTAEEGNSFLDRMILMIEGARRQLTPNEIALNIVLISLTALFIVVVLVLPAMAIYDEKAANQTGAVLTSLPVLLSLIVCLIPTTIGGLLSAIGIAGIDRLMRRNVLATSGRAVEAAGDVDVLLLDKTGTITLGNRMATEFIPAPGIDIKQLADAAQLASLADETPEGRSIVTLAKDEFGLRGRDVAEPHVAFVPFSAQTRMSGVDLDGRRIRKGASESVKAWVIAQGGSYPDEVAAVVERISKDGGTPLVVAEVKRVLGVILLKDIVKGGIK